MYLYAKNIDFASSYDFIIRFWNCSGSVLFSSTLHVRSHVAQWVR